MKYVLALAMTAALAGYGYVQFGPDLLSSSKVADTFSGQVVDVIDGDSMKVRRGNQLVRVELNGVDAPELDQSFGEISSYYLSDLVEGREVRVVVQTTNEFGDLVGEVFLDSISINRIMLTDGYAWAKRGMFEDPSWAGLESLARSKGLGLWRDGEPMSPWAYRKMVERS